MRFAKTFAAAVALLCASGASASITTAGYVTDVYGMSQGVVLFNSSGSRTATPSCQGSSVPQRWAFDVTTPAGQARLAQLLTAFSLHKQILVYGTSACGSWVDSESVDFFIVLGS